MEIGIHWLRSHVFACLCSHALNLPRVLRVFVSCFSARSHAPSMAPHVSPHCNCLCQLVVLLVPVLTPPSTRSCQSTSIIDFPIDRKPREKEKQKQTRLTLLTHPPKLPTLAPQLVLTEEKKEIASREKKKMMKTSPRFVAPVGNS